MSRLVSVHWFGCSLVCNVLFVMWIVLFPSTLYEVVATVKYTVGAAHPTIPYAISQRERDSTNVSQILDVPPVRSPPNHEDFISPNRSDSDNQSSRDADNNSLTACEVVFPPPQPPWPDLYLQPEQRSPYTLQPNMSFSQKVLIVAPVHNSAATLASWFRVLCSLTYPRRLLAVALGEDSSTDGTLQVARELAKMLARDFRRIEVFTFNISVKGKIAANRHSQPYQLVRRTHLARARNLLLSHALQHDDDHVLWLDSDVHYTPPDLVQHMLSARADVVAASCFIRGKLNENIIKLYDSNSWRETKASLSALAHKDPGYLMLEGYRRTKRRFLPDIRDEGLVVALDGVGGTALMVRAFCFRVGLVFTPVLFEHHIETEGLGKMAVSMNFSVRGLPFITVFHAQT